MLATSSTERVGVAELTPPDCLEQYALAKRACQAPALRDIVDLSDPLDQALPDEMTGSSARHVYRRYWQLLNRKPARW